MKKTIEIDSVLYHDFETFFMHKGIRSQLDSLLSDFTLSYESDCKAYKKQIKTYIKMLKYTTTPDFYVDDKINAEYKKYCSKFKEWKEYYKDGCLC